MDDLTVPTFHHAYAEYGARYHEPALEKWEMGKLSQALLRGLIDWNVNLENISFRQIGETMYNDEVRYLESMGLKVE